MTTRNRQAVAATLACLCAALLAGCTNDSPKAGQPNTAPPSSSSTPTSSSSAAPSSGGTSSPRTPTAAPTRPSTAEGATLASAEAFVGYYVGLINYTYDSGDGQPLLAESDKGCVGCNALAAYLRKINGRNGGLQGDYKTTLLDIKEIVRGEEGRLSGSATIKSGTYEERATPGASPVPQEGRNGSLDFSLASSAGRWVMFEMQLKE